MDSVVCRVCGHDHNCEEGEVCGICGHMDTTAMKPESQSALPVMNPPQASEILPDFLYLGCFSYAMRVQVLEAQGITRVLNTVPGHEYGLKKHFTCHSLPKGNVLPFDDAVQFLDQCEKDKVRVLVYCMTGKRRSPAIVIAYLMRCKRWRLGQSCEWVKERRPSVDLSPDVIRQLQEYEQKILVQEYEQKNLGSVESNPLPLKHASGSIKEGPLRLERVFNSVESSPSQSNHVPDGGLYADYEDDPDLNAFLSNFNAELLGIPHGNILAEREERRPSCLPRRELHFGIHPSLLKRKVEPGRAI